MKKRCLAAVFVVAMLSGCTDTIDTVTREYRNANNECIDAMMMVTSEARAGVMITRVFKPAIERYDAIDKRLKIVRNNRVQEEFVVETFESQGLHLYLTELEVNQQRFGLEMVRLRNLAKQYKDADQECPNLLDILKDPGVLGPLRAELSTPKLPQLMEQFTGWTKVKEYPKKFYAFEEKRKKYRLTQDIELVR